MFQPIMFFEAFFPTSVIWKVIKAQLKSFLKFFFNIGNTPRKRIAYWILRVFKFTNLHSKPDVNFCEVLGKKCVYWLYFMETEQFNFFSSVIINRSPWIGDLLIRHFPPLRSSKNPIILMQIFNMFQHRSWYVWTEWIQNWFSPVRNKLNS